MHCEPWNLEHLLVQRLLVRKSFAQLGKPIADRLADDWVTSIVECWPNPMLLVREWHAIALLETLHCERLRQVGLARLCDHVHTCAQNARALSWLLWSFQGVAELRYMS